MDDRMLMESLLVSAKNAATLYLHGSIEAADGNIKSAFNQALTETLKMQTDIYNTMAQKGWYPTTMVEQQKIQQVAQKFQGKC